MMPRMSRRVDDVQKEFAEDFTVVNGNLLLCKFCDSIVKWQKKTRIIEHLNTKMHAERKELKMQRFLAEMQSQAGNDDDDFDQDDEVASAHDSIWEQEEPRGIDPNEAQYCLKWNNHQSNMIEVFNRLFGDEQFTDVLIAADGRKIRAHKIVLSACSSYFENLFMTFDEKNQIVILKDANYIDVFAIIEFIYKGEVNVGQDQLPSLLQTAENLKVKGLSETSSNVQGHSPGDTSKYRTIPSYGNANYRRSICNTHTPVKTISAQFSSIPASNSSFVTASMTSGQNANERGNKRSSFDAKRDIVNENSIRQIYSQKIPNSILRTSSPTSNVRPIVASSITSSQNSGGTVTVSPTINSLKHFRDLSPVSSISIGGDQIKRKRGRPRILDSDTDLFEQLHDTEEQDRQDDLKAGNISAFGLWSKDTRRKLMEELPLQIGASIKKKALVDIWRSLPKHDKRKWRKKARLYRLSLNQTEVKSYLDDRSGKQDIRSRERNSQEGTSAQNSCLTSNVFCKPYPFADAECSNLIENDRVSGKPASKLGSMRESILSRPKNYEDNLVIVDVTENKVSETKKSFETKSETEMIICDVKTEIPDTFNMYENKTRSDEFSYSSAEHINDINIMQGNGSCDATFGSGIIESPLKIKSSNKMPTPGGPLTEERIKELGVIKMNDYLSNGTRPQFWEEYFVKVIMHAVNNKEIDVKGAAALLGASYSQVYSRYQKLFGYLKTCHITVKGMKLLQIPKITRKTSVGLNKSSSVIRTDSAEAEVSCDGSPAKLSNFPTDGNFFTGNIDFETGMMAVPLDLDMEDGDASYDDNMTDAQMDVSGGATGMSENENSKSSIRITNLQSGSTLNKNLYKQKVEEDEDGVPAPITIAKQSKDVAKKVFC